MKQVLQSLKSGELMVLDVPAPATLERGILVQNRASVVSVGTEKTVVDFAQSSLLGKARSRPDLVRQAVEKMKRDGLMATIDAMSSRLDQPMPLGYSCSGVVTEVGNDAAAFRTGDRVACAGGGYAVHAEFVSIPRNLAVTIPENVDFESAAFSTLGAIALQGLRLAQVNLGELVAVIGLGLIGQLSIQLAKAAGCRVIGLDPQPNRAALGKTLGADFTTSDTASLQAAIADISSGHGVDAVLITADTSSNEPVTLAGSISRRKGIVVAVGAVGMSIPRKTFYEKEIDFRISCSYGPGRYDTSYEDGGQDYPYAYVRWTEQRNMQAFIDLLSAKKIDVQKIISHRFPIEDASRAYELVSRKTEPFLGVLLTYSATTEPQRLVQTPQAKVSIAAKKESNPPTLKVGLLGAGNFSRVTMLPILKKMPVLELKTVCAATGNNSRYVADKFSFQHSATTESAVYDDPSIDIAIIATRHHLHAEQVVKALSNGKHVFCEKPIAINRSQLAMISEAVSHYPDRLLMVGFNRRFASLTQKLKSFLAATREPLVINYRVNAGHIPLNHWVHDPVQGGGRIIGEVCHFVDYLIYLSGSLPRSIHAKCLPNGGRYNNDNLVITVALSNGSLGTISYFANGDRSFSKERVEVSGGGSIAVLDDFRKLTMTRNGKREVVHSWLRADKGHAAEWHAFAEAVAHGTASPIPLDEIIATTNATFDIADSLKNA